MRFLAFLWAFLSLTQACTEKTSALKHGGGGHDHPEEVAPLSPEEAQALSYYKDIKPILAASCESCHVSGGLAPFALTSYAQVKRLGSAIREAVLTRRMPPWNADPGHQKYRDDLSLNPESLSKLTAWIDNGYKQGNASDYKPISKNPQTFDVMLPVLPKGEAYLPDQEWTDEYRCFVIPIPDSLAETPWVTGFSTIPGNPKIVHHLVAHTVDSDILWAIQKLDADEEGLGYRCAGGALPDAISGIDVQEGLEAIKVGTVDRLMTGTHWLAHWAPGMDEGTTLPEGMGLKLPVGGAMILQMHYYVETSPGEVDSNSLVALKLAKSVEKPAFYYPLTNMDWLLGIFNQSMVIPPLSEASFSVEANFADIAAFGRQTLGLAESTVKNLEAHSANLHMHAIGKSGLVTMEKAGQLTPPETLLSISNWDLHWQRDYQFLVPKIIPAQDLKLWTRKLRCDYKNPNDVPVYGGPASSHEMCYDFALFAFDLQKAPLR